MNDAKSTTQGAFIWEEDHSVHVPSRPQEYYASTGCLPSKRVIDLSGSAPAPGEGECHTSGAHQHIPLDSKWHVHRQGPSCLQLPHSPGFHTIKIPDLGKSGNLYKSQHHLVREQHKPGSNLVYMYTNTSFRPPTTRHWVYPLVCTKQQAPHKESAIWLGWHPKHFLC